MNKIKKTNISDKEDRDGNKETLTKEEVTEADRCDRITPEMLKGMEDRGLDLFTKICNISWSTAKILKYWEVASLLPIFK